MSNKAPFHLQSFKNYVSNLELQGEKIALIDIQSGKSYTHKLLAEEIYSTTHTLGSLAEKGDRVVLFHLRGPEWIITFLAAALLGIVSVPIDDRASADMVEGIIEATQPKLIISNGQATDTKSIINSVSPEYLRSSQNSAKVFPDIDGADPLEILFTSGTWSSPKAVTLSHTNVLSNVFGIQQIYAPPHKSTFLSLLPLSHAYEQTVGLLVPLCVDSTIVYLAEITAKQLTQSLSSYKVTIIVAVPRVLELLRSSILKSVHSPKVRKIFCKVVPQMRVFPVPIRRALFFAVHKKLGKHLKTLVISGAPLSKDLDYFFQGLGYETIVGYGLSETAPALTISLKQNRAEGEVGQPLPNVKIGTNSEGEILAQGPNIFLGYWPSMNSTDEFNTQDLGRIDRDGTVHIKGRTKNLVIFPSGDKIFLEEIERIADALESVRESCAISLEDRQEIIVLVIGTATSSQVLKEQINDNLPYFARVSKVIILKDELPRTHTLKLNRRKALNLLDDQN